MHPDMAFIYQKDMCCFGIILLMQIIKDEFFRMSQRPFSRVEFRE